MSLSAALRKQFLAKQSEKAHSSATVPSASSATQRDKKRDRSDTSTSKKKRRKPNKSEQQLSATKSQTKQPQPSGAARTSKVFDRVHKQLAGGHFRWLNEQLYTTKGAQALQTFRKDPSLFDVYHAGYSSQVEKWPKNPLTLIMNDLRAHLDACKRSLVIADLGCGEARLAAELSAHKRVEKIYSFDLIADAARNITAADLASLPLADDSVDVVVFCLSLMGTNWPKFVAEARRVLKRGGLLKIAEVGSRFVNRKTFQSQLAASGFNVTFVDDETDFFLRFNAKLVNKATPVALRSKQLRPCLYKKR